VPDETIDRLPLAPGDRGEAVRDLHRRLVAAGVEPPSGPPDDYGPQTLEAVRHFQATRGLPTTGTCDPLTWTTIVEAGFRLGDRLLYLRSPMLRGDDVADLQLRLGALGFDAGRVDGIFGPDTERALKDFQRNFALTIDGVCGRDVVNAFQLLGSRIDQATPVVGVRERERLRRAPRALHGRRVVLGEAGGLDAITTALARAVQAAGAVVAVQQHPDPSVQAAEANRFEADLYLGLEIDDVGPCRAAYYATAGFQSIGGHQLATVITAALEHELGLGCTPPQGMRLPVLRETRMPAVVCALGPASAVVEAGSPLAKTLATALARWTDSPVES
jgi:N-acetylmuramoyl-L-alanine amidase